MNKDLEKGIQIPLMESFYSIQGEGYYSGHSAYFLRVGGCDVGCHWCDVKESWDAKKHPLTKVDEIINEIKNFDPDTVVVTGGEPLMWNMSYITKRIKDLGIKIHLETSGSYELTGDWDWICLSPKKLQKPKSSMLRVANELKVIVQNKHDFKWAEEQRILAKNNCKLYLQPEWRNKDKITPLIIEYVMKNSDWRISLQTHKILGLP